MSDDQPDIAAPQIPKDLVDRYVCKYPHLSTLARNMLVPAMARHAAKVFAQTCCRLTAPGTVTVKEAWLIAGVAEGKPWPHEA